MRILHVSDAFLPKSGGIEVQVGDLAQRQVAMGHEVTVVTCAPGEEDEHEGVRVVRVDSPWLHIPASAAQLKALMDEHDVLHAHLSVLSPLAILATRTAARHRFPAVVTLHSLWWLATPLYVIATWVVRWHRWPVHWTAVSELAAGALRRALGRHGEVAIMPNGVEPADWAVVPAHRDPADVVAVSVMRLAARKRPRQLLRAVRRARRSLPDHVRLSVLVVGDGPLQERLERDVERLGLQDVVVLTGRLGREQIRDLYRRADLYLAPATLESFGIAALEARCAGLPVIARDRTGIADFIDHGRHGLLARSDAALATALAELAADPARRARMSAANRAEVPQTSWDDVLQRCELAYKAAAGLVEPHRSAALA